MPDSRGCRVLLREEVLSGVEDVLQDGTADLAISGLDITGYLGAQLGSVEFVAVAQAHHPLHQLQRKLSAHDLQHQMQIVVRDSGRRQPRDSGWLAPSSAGRSAAWRPRWPSCAAAWASPGCRGT